MAVSSTTSVQSDGLYVPFRNAQRGGPSGSDPVGTLFVNAEATGAAGGGTVTINITMRRQEFGFPIIWVPTYITTLDTLASVGKIVWSYLDTGNERLGASINEAVVAVATGLAINAGVVAERGVAIDPTGETALAVMSAIWDDNVDTKAYHVHVFGAVFDRQVMALSDGSVHDLLAGIR